MVNDESLLNDEDKIAVRLYSLGTYQYNNERDSYATRSGYGVRDSENSRLFHISMPGPSAWISPGKEFVIDVNQISIGSGENKDYSWEEYEVNNVKYIVKLPLGSLLSRYSYGLDNAIFEDDNIKYTLDLVTAGYYKTSLMFYIDYSNSSIADMEQNADFLNALYDKRDDFMKDLIVTVNGVDCIGAQANSYAVTVDDDCCYFYTDLLGSNNIFINDIVITHNGTSYEIN